jgi:glycerate kinase
VPLLAIVGDIENGIEKVYDEGVSAIFSINRRVIPFKEAKLRTKSDLKHTMENLMKFMRCFPS